MYVKKVILVLIQILFFSIFSIFLSNIIMRGIETVIIDKLFVTNLLKSYIRYVDDTFVMQMKKQILTSY